MPGIRLKSQSEAFLESRPCGADIHISSLDLQLNNSQVDSVQAELRHGTRALELESRCSECLLDYIALTMCSDRLVASGPREAAYQSSAGSVVLDRAAAVCSLKRNRRDRSSPCWLPSLAPWPDC